MNLREFFVRKENKITTLFNNVFSSISVFNVPSQDYHERTLTDMDEKELLN